MVQAERYENAKTIVARIRTAVNARRFSGIVSLVRGGGDLEGIENHL